ncbi:MAG: hypothetical protein M1827_001079 [Pycnora praestabilis]|nr:MAG: hypothetical protein M1827_001079 [Pycnora praestabilis]
MVPTFTSVVLCASFIFSASYAQSVTVPSDLSSAFDPNTISLQVNYAGNAEAGFADGTTFTPQNTSQAPVFALGDASGVNTAISFMIAMLDTTSSSSRVLHFLQADFKANGDRTGLSSSSQPAVPYRGPGSFPSESGTRDYSFLLYQQPSDNFKVKDLPTIGATFDVEGWQTVNGLQAADAGVVMVVDLGGSNATSSSGQSSQSASSSPQSSSLSAAPSTAAPASSAPQPSSSAAASLAISSVTITASAVPSSLTSASQASTARLASTVMTTLTMSVAGKPSPSSGSDSASSTAAGNSGTSATTTGGAVPATTIIKTAGAVMIDVGRAKSIMSLLAVLVAGVQLMI